jgi:outer membrane protein OmpA-like peptidoglycan-associated protein
MNLFKALILVCIFVLTNISVKGQVIDSVPLNTASLYKWQIAHQLILTDFIDQKQNSSDRRNEKTRGMELNFGRYLKKGIWLNMPLRIGFPKNSVDTTGKPYYSLDATLIKQFTWKRLSSYISSGASVQLLSNKANLGVPLSIGLNLELDKGFFLNFQTVYRHSFQAANDQHIYSGGLSFRFGSNQKRIKPNLPKLEQNPLPTENPQIEEPVNPWIVKDADSDGVVDSLDRCPLVFGPMSNWGCPVQVSKPEIAVAPDTIKHLPVASTHPAQRSQKATFIVYFDFDESSLTHDTKKTLDAIIAQYKNVLVKDLLIQGYSDDLGTDSYNLKLSDKRAIQCADYLTNNHFNAQHIVIQGLGEQNAVGHDAQDRNKDRRVCLTLVY